MAREFFGATSLPSKHLAMWVLSAAGMGVSYNHPDVQANTKISGGSLRALLEFRFGHRFFGQVDNISR
jgi:hypothetical protein